MVIFKSIFWTCLQSFIHGTVRRRFISLFIGVCCQYLFQCRHTYHCFAPSHIHHHCRYKKVDLVLHFTSNCFVSITIITNLCSPGIFTVEMCAKIFAMGFICHENSYLRYCQCTYTYGIRIVTQGKLPLVLISAIMSSVII